MKVIIIADNLGGGAARLGKNLIQSIAKKLGWENLIILGNGRINLEYKNIGECLEYHEIKTHWLPRFIQRQLFVQKYPSDYVVLNLTNFPLGTKFLNTKKEICIIHSAYFFATPPNLPSFGIKFVMRVIIARRLLFNFLKILSSSTKTVFVVQTPWMKNLWQKSLHRRYKVEIARLHEWPVFSSFVPTSNILKEMPTASSNLDEEIIWFYPATAEPHKNHELLFDLFAAAIKNNPNIKLIVTLPFGEIFTRRLMETANSLSIKHAIQNIGWVDENQKNYFLKKCSGIIFLSDFESLGIPLIEILKLSKRAVVLKSEASEHILGPGLHTFDLNSTNKQKQKEERQRFIVELSTHRPVDVQYRKQSLIEICDSYFFDWV